jgi:hypothetical protein
MGPPILLDKSGIQFLPRKLLPALSKYYLLVVPPILVQEILGDLPKTHQGGCEWMRILSEKIQSGFFCMNMDHRDLRATSLLGKQITMDGRPVVEAQEFDTTLGKGVLVTETKEHWQLRRWQFEKLTPFDEQSAKEWKEFISTVDLEKTKAHLKLTNSEMPKVKSFAELGATVDTLLGFGNQQILLEMRLKECHLMQRKSWIGMCEKLCSNSKKFRSNSRIVRSKSKFNGFKSSVKFERLVRRYASCFTLTATNYEQYQEQ